MPQAVSDLGSILTAHLFAKVERLLVELLRSLTAADWEAPTVAPKWKVKDVAAHLLDTELRKLSMARDGHSHPGLRFRPDEDLVSFVNRLNAEGVAFHGRLSPAVIASLIETVSPEYAAYHESLDPFVPARFGVSWAGEQTSLNWFDTAREFTERWHHQQQIRLALNRPGLMTQELYHPVLDCFMRALPYTYREQGAADGTLLQFELAGECGGTWWLYREDANWRLISGPGGEPTAHITIPQEIAWRIFTKGIDPASAEVQITIEGDRGLGRHVLNSIAIVG